MVCQQMFEEMLKLMYCYNKKGHPRKFYQKALGMDIIVALFRE